VNARTRPAHVPDPLCALEAEAVELRRARDAGLTQFAQMPHDGTAGFIAAAASLPRGYAARGTLTVTASATRSISAVAGPRVDFHYEIAGCVVTRAMALDALRCTLAAAPHPTHRQGAST